MCAAACARDPVLEVRIGDAIPRTVLRPTLLDVARPLLNSGATTRVALTPWTASAEDFGVGEAEQARLFISDSSVVAVVGHAGSKATLFVESMYRDAGMPLIVPTATARALRDRGAHLFLLAPPDNLLGAFLVDQAMDRLKARRIGVMHVADPYGDGIRDGVLERLQQRGDSAAGLAALTGRECEFDSHAIDAIVRAFVARTTPDAVIVALPQKAAWCATKALVRERPDILVLTSDSFIVEAGSPLTAAERTNVHALVFWEPGTDSLTTRFVNSVRTTMLVEPEPSHALVFDAYQLVAAAVREGHTTRQGVLQWLRQLGTPGHPPFQGITGPIDFTAPRTSVLHLKALRDTLRVP